MRPRTRMPHARGAAPVRHDPPEKRRYGPPKTKTVALPVLPPAGVGVMARRATFLGYAVAGSGLVVSTPSRVPPVSTKTPKGVNKFFFISPMGVPPPPP